MEQLIERINKAPAWAKYGGLAIVAVIVTAVNYFMFIQDIEDKIQRAITQEGNLERTLAEKQDIANNLADRRRELDQLEQKLADALTELPDKKEIEELLAQLNDLGRKSGLDIAKVTPESEVAAGFISKIPIKMSVSGNYHEIAMFLQEVANMRRIVNANNIALSMGQSKTDKVVLKADFTATTFRFLDQSGKQGDNSAAGGGAAASAPGGGR